VRPCGTRGVCFAALVWGVPGFASRGWMRLGRVLIGADGAARIVVELVVGVVHRDSILEMGLCDCRRWVGEAC
jgi:hypothetical protein